MEMGNVKHVMKKKNGSGEEKMVGWMSFLPKIRDVMPAAYQR